MAIRRPTDIEGRHPQAVTLFVCGDVMTGRGIDQILPNPGGPELFESWVTSAVRYVEMAEVVAGPIPRGADFEYVWGDALAELERVRPAVRIVNLETAITTAREAWPQKDIHYRMNPANVPCLTAARIDCCALANNHVLDWGRAGLEETLDTLHAAGICTAGAGRNELEAAAPAVMGLPGGVRVLVFAFGAASSGVPREWQATPDRSGVNWLEDLSSRSIDTIVRQVSRHTGDGSIVVASIHWAGNWGFGVSRQEREFAHRLIDTVGVDLVHGHSSHHVKGIECYQRKAILYGCGDLLNDYEGIGGYDLFRGDLALLYFPVLDADSGDLVSLSMTPMCIRRFRIKRAAPDAVAWLAGTLDQECGKLGTRVTRQPDGRLALQWEQSAVS
jgi:poly-gamma-glutamate capsule biosynthesis protein CapA/YwtB (metallophosphatase superfamily)